MKKNYLRVIISLAILIIAGFLIYQAVVVHCPELWQALKSGKEQDIEAFLMDSDRKEGTIFLALLQFIQVISIVIPSAPIQIAGGMVYGFLRGYFICHFTYVLANCLVIFILRHFSAVNEMIGNSGKEKIQKIIGFMNQGDPFVTIMLLCMIPVIPNGLIPYAASQMNIKIKDFALAVFSGSLYPVVSMVLCGKFILTGDYLVSAVIAILNIIVVYALYRRREQVSVFIGNIKNKFSKKQEL